VLKIAVCDDEKLQLEYTEKLVRRELSAQEPAISVFSSGAAFLDAVGRGYSPDIAVLDIRLGDMDGIALARRLNGCVPGCRIIFLTAYLKMATEVYTAEHVYFVVKSEMEERMGGALRKAAEARPAQAAAEPSVLIKEHSGFSVYSASDILYAERTGRKTRVVTVSGELWTAQSPPELFSGQAGETFIHCHQSFWVNIRRVSAMKSSEFCLSNGDHIPISRSCRERARERFFSLLRGEE
jgi:DNA-binding LytR/AlgR family response regulator